MDAVEFYRQFARYCTTSYCGACNIVDYCKTKTKDGRDAEKIVREIEQWAKDHPVKTRQSEFLKMFPNAKRGIDGILCIDPCKIDITCEEVCEISKTDCDECKRTYWLTEVADNG